MNARRDTLIIDLRAPQWPQGRQSGHGLRRARWLIGVLLFCAAMRPVAHAQIDAPQTPPQTLTVQVLAPAASRLIERVRGQLSDLPVVIVAATPEASDALTHRSNVDGPVHVRVRFESLAPTMLGWRITITDEARGEQQQREVTGDGMGAMAQSAIDEAAALIVRVALQSILQGESIAHHDNAADTHHAHDAPTATSAPAKPGPTDQRATTAETNDVTPPDAEVVGSSTVARTSQPWLGVGAATHAIDRDFHLLFALQAYGGIQLRRVALGVTLDFGLPSTLRSEVATVQLTQHGLHAIARFDLWALDAAVLALHVGLGLTVFQRATQRVQAGWSATEDRSLLSPSANVQLQWRLRVLAGLCLQLSLGARVLGRVPTLRQQDDSGARNELSRLAWLMPAGALSVEWAP